MSPVPSSASPFHPASPVPPGGILGGQRECRNALRAQIDRTVDTRGSSISIVGPPKTGRTSLLNYTRFVAEQAKVLPVQLDFSRAVLDIECDVAAAIVSTVVIALEGAGALADHDDRRHAWIGQCARVAVPSAAADPLLLTPGQRALFTPDMLLRDLDVLCDHARSCGWTGIVLTIDNADECDIPVRNVVKAMSERIASANHCSVVIAGSEPMTTLVLDITPLDAKDILRMGEDASGVRQRPYAQNVLSAAEASAVASATAGLPGDVAFCLDRMWQEAPESDRRLRLTSALLRDLIKLGPDAESARVEFLNSIDSLSNDQFGNLHFFATFEGMSEGQLARLMVLMSGLETGVSDGAADAGRAISKMLESLSEDGLIQRHEDRFTALEGDVFAHEYLRCTVSERGLSARSFGGASFGQIAAFQISGGLAESMSPPARHIAASIWCLDESDTDTDLVGRVRAVDTTAVSDLLDLRLAALYSAFGLRDLGKPALLVAVEICGCIDDACSIPDERLQLLVLLQTESEIEEPEAFASAWFEERQRLLSQARLRVDQISAVSLSPESADSLRVALAPTSGLITMFGAFTSDQFDLAAAYTAQVVDLCGRLNNRQRRARGLAAVAEDLKSRLVFLKAIVGDRDGASALAEQLASDTTDWLGTYNRALLAAQRGEWIRAAEALSDLEHPLRPKDGVTEFYMLVHCPGMAEAPTRIASEYFASVPGDQIDEFVEAQRTSIEAMSGRHAKASYLSHLQGLQVPAARRIAAWTVATKFSDPSLAITLLGQLEDADPSNAATYLADMEELKAAR